MNTDPSPHLVLVTGATGFIGGSLAQRLLEVGWPLRLLVRDPARLPASLRGKAEVVAGDLTDPTTLGGAVQGVAVVFHCAANVRTWDSWEDYFAANVQGVVNLVEAVGRENPGLRRFVHLSTVDVYGFPQEPCDESCPADGGSFGYGRSKWLGEQHLRAECGRAGIPWTVIRPCNVIGPGSQFISRIGTELKSGLMLKVDGGRANAGLLYVDELVDCLLWAAQAAAGECYNVRAPYDVTWAEFLARFKDGIGGRGLVLSVPFPVADAAAWLLQSLYRVLLPGREPLLHRLLVRLFGRTCGHRIDKIRLHGGPLGRIGFDEAMQRSVRWFLSQSR